MNLLQRLRQIGQALDSELAERSGMTAAQVNAELADDVAASRVVCCHVRSPKGVPLGIEYRISGTYPRVRPGPKPT